jgi:hypothetical protein
MLEALREEVEELKKERDWLKVQWIASENRITKYKNGEHEASGDTVTVFELNTTAHCETEA